MGYRYEVEYSAWYEVESDVPLTEDEVIEQAVEQHGDMPNGTWSLEYQEEN
jgi:hypothetical protein